MRLQTTLQRTHAPRKAPHVHTQPVTSRHARVQHVDITPPGARPGDNGLGKSNSPHVCSKHTHSFPVITQDRVRQPLPHRLQGPIRQPCPVGSGHKRADKAGGQGPRSNGPLRTKRHSTQHMLPKYRAGGRRECSNRAPMGMCVLECCPCEAGKVTKRGRGRHFAGASFYIGADLGSGGDCRGQKRIILHKIFDCGEDLCVQRGLKWQKN